jgi:hypothetical protein
MRGPDIIGKRFGRLLVRCKVRNGRWLADCDCGGTRKGYVGEFISGGLTRCQHCNARLWSGQQDEFSAKEHCSSRRNFFSGCVVAPKKIWQPSDGRTSTQAQVKPIDA